MEDKYRDLIKQEFVDCAADTLGRVKKSLANKEAAGNHKPFHEAILIREAILWSKFERSFSTSFGQRLVEEVSRLLALASGATKAEKQRETTVELDTAYLAHIEEHLAEIREGKRRGIWESDLIDIKATKLDGEVTRERVITDLWFERDGEEYFLSIKTVKPNIDQTAEAKRDLLKIKLHDEDANVFFGLYYNPWGDNKTDYAHSPPMKVFDFNHDLVVLIGKEYWNLIGGDGAYQLMLEIAAEAGVETQKIVEEFKQKFVEGEELGDEE
jgi:hypothetical protein